MDSQIFIQTSCPRGKVIFSKINANLRSDVPHLAGIRFIVDN